MKQLGLSLVKDKVLSRAQMDAVLLESEAGGKTLVQALLDRALVDDKFLARYLSATFHYQLVNEEEVRRLPPRPKGVPTLPKDLVEEAQCFVMEGLPEAWKVLVVDPTERPALAELGFL